MNHRRTTLCVMLGSLFLIAGCGANIELQKGNTDLQETLQSSTFYLELHDGSTSRPDNLDGYLNMLWTSDARRAALVTKHVVWLTDELAKSGFTFVDSISECSVHTELTIKSVRFDPWMGWLTDDARITYTDRQSGTVLGVVVADEIWFTPTVDMVFGALVKGSLQLWGQTTDE